MEMACFPVGWTDVGEPDPFVALSLERAMARVEDLLRLVQLVKDLKREPVKEIKPDM